MISIISFLLDFFKREENQRNKLTCFYRKLYGKIQEALIEMFLPNKDISSQFRHWEKVEGVNFFEMVRIDCMVTETVSKIILLI